MVLPVRANVLSPIATLPTTFVGSLGILADDNQVPL